MTWTITKLEDALIDRTKAMMVLASLDVSNTGTNKALAGPIISALQLLGYSVADFQVPVDADVSAVSVSDALALLDAAEVYLLSKVILSIATRTDIRLGQRQESLSQTTATVMEALRMKQEALTTTHGISVEVLETGLISTDFQTKGDDEAPTSWL